METGRAGLGDPVVLQDRPRIVVHQNHQQLFGAVDLGIHKTLHARDDVAIGAGYAGVRGDMISVPLRRHHMARSTAEGGSVHIGDAAIAGRAHDHEVDEGRDHHKHDAAPKDRIAQVDLGKGRRHLAGGLERTPPEEYPNRNQNQAQNEKAGKNQVEENAEIGIGWNRRGRRTGRPKSQQG